MGGQTHEQPATVADATENTASVEANENQSANAANEIAPETENPTAQGETVADANPQAESNPDDGAVKG